MLPQFSHLATSCCVLAAQSLLETVSFLPDSQTHTWPSFSEQVPCHVYLQRETYLQPALSTFHLLSSSFQVSWLFAVQEDGWFLSLPTRVLRRLLRRHSPQTLLFSGHPIVWISNSPYLLRLSFPLKSKPKGTNKMKP